MIRTRYIVFNIILIISASVNSEDTEKEKPKNKEEGEKKDGAPNSVDSRFFDLGGMFNQLFLGFNQGMQGGRLVNPGGMGFPANSQFQPAIAGQFQNQGNFGNPQQSQFQNQGNFGNPQQPQFQNQGNFGNPQQPQFQNQGNFGNPQQMQNPGQGNDLGPVQYPNRGDSGNAGGINQDIKPVTEENYDGTLNGIMSQQPGAANNWNNQQNDLGQSNTRNPNAILGRPVIVTSTTIPDGQIFFPTSTQSPWQKQCVQDCESSSEYKPVCGTDNVTYFNFGKFICARNCGIDVYVSKEGRCPGDIPSTRL